MGEDRGAVKVKALVHEVIVGNLGGNGGVFLIGMLLVVVAELVLHQLAVQRPDTSNREILAGEESVVRGEESEALELDLFPPRLQGVCVSEDHSLGKRSAHRVGEDALSKEGGFHLVGDCLKGADVGSFLGRFQVEHIADNAEVLLGLTSSPTKLFRASRSQL